MGEAELSGVSSQVLNPYSDLIFQATGAKSCRDSHRAERDNSPSLQVLDNDLARNLRSEAKGIHGPDVLLTVCVVMREGKWELRNAWGRTTETHL